MISVEVKGKLPTLNADLTDAMTRCAKIMEDGIRDHWTNRGPGLWPALRSGQRATLKGPQARMYNALSRKSGEEQAEAGVYGVPYARYQQFGANPTVTARSKRYFWAMYYGTGLESWKWMALQPLGKKMHIPPRAFAVWTPEMLEEVLKVVGESIVTFTDAKGESVNQRA